MALQALAGGGAGGEVPFVVIVAGQAAGAGLVDVFPGGVHREFVGDALGPLVLVEAVGVGRGAFLEIVLGTAAGAVGAGLCAVRHRVAVIEILAFFLALQHRVGLQGFLDFLLEVQREELEQSDGLLQLRGHRQLLAHLED